MEWGTITTLVAEVLFGGGLLVFVTIKDKKTAAILDNMQTVIKEERDLAKEYKSEIASLKEEMNKKDDTIRENESYIRTLHKENSDLHDKLDKASFPTRGVAGNVDFTWKDMINASSDSKALGYGSLVAGFEGYVPIIENRLVMIPQFYLSVLFGKGSVNGTEKSWNPVFNGPVPAYPSMNNIIGGTEMGRYIDQQIPFIGLSKVSLAFNNVAVARMDIRTRLFGNHYLTAMFNYARSGIDLKNFFKERETLLWENMYDYNASNWWGAGVRYSIDTKLGPLSFDVSSSNISKKVNLYFNFGYYF